MLNPDRLIVANLPRTEYPFARDYQPGTWKGLHVPGGRNSATFTCPKCGQTMALLAHTIDRHGKVWPLVVCARDGMCDWRGLVTLRGWRS